MAKVTLYVDDEIWSKFRKAVFRKYGSLRKLSDEVEALLGSSLVEDKVTLEFEKLGIKAEGTISSREVKERRPTLRGPPSEELVKKMRQRRIAEAVS